MRTRRCPGRGEINEGDSEGADLENGKGNKVGSDVWRPVRAGLKVPEEAEETSEGRKYLLMENAVSSRRRRILNQPTSTSARHIQFEANTQALISLTNVLSGLFNWSTEEAVEAASITEHLNPHSQS